MCWDLIKVFGLPPVLPVGLMLLAASPGGISANLFSHLFCSHVALNISPTAIKTLLSKITLALIANLALQLHSSATASCHCRPARWPR